MTLRPTLRPGRDEDADSFIALIAACWAEYPGCLMDVDGENPELRVLASHFAEAGGALWVQEQDGAVAGMVGVRPETPTDWELCRMYLAPALRGAGVAATLLATAEDFARMAGATRLHLWSDTRFDRAHRFYERHGFIREGGIRPLHDISNSLEFGYAKPLSGLVVRVLDIAAAGSAARSLGRILQSCVAAGDPVGFLPPLDLAGAEAVYRTIATGIAKGTSILLAGWLDGVLAGSVVLDLAMPQNQPHRAAIRMLVVAAPCRRRGMARVLLRAAEQQAVRLGRTLLTIETSVGDPSEALCRSEAWIETGRIPGLILAADGTFRDTMLFYKPL